MAWHGMAWHCGHGMALHGMALHGMALQNVYIFSSLRSADDHRVSREVELVPPTPAPMKNKTESQNEKLQQTNLAKDNGQELGTKPKETDAKSKVADERSLQNDPATGENGSDNKQQKTEVKSAQEAKEESDRSSVVKEEPQALNKPKPTDLKFEGNIDMSNQRISAAAENVKEDTKAVETESKHENKKELDPSSENREELIKPKETESNSEMSNQRDSAAVENVKEYTKAEKTERTHENNKELENDRLK